jgi:hypothetical protein
LRRHAVCSPDPGVVKGGVVSIADRTGDGGNLSEIRAAVRDIGERPGPELVMERVLEEQSHV